MLTEKQCNEVLLAYHERGYDAAGKLFLRLFQEDAKNVTTWLARADGELSAIAHGRPPSPKDELVKLSDKLRGFYEPRLA